MTNTLCIETSGAHCSLALSVAGQIYNLDRQLQRSHNQHLLSLLDELLAQAGLRPPDIELVAFGCGPGSFTGVRIAAAACQAVALASDAPVVALPTSLALALSAQQAAPEARSFVCSIKSRGDAYYLSTFVAADSTPLAVGQIRADELLDTPPAWLDDECGSDKAEAAWVGAGSQPPWWPPRITMPWMTQVFPRARDSMAWVVQQHEAGLSQSAEHALPRYIVGDSPWKKSASG